MAKLDLTDIDNLQNETTVTAAINANNAAVESAINNSLSRDGSMPNYMQNILDMNGYRIINMPHTVEETDAVRLSDVEDLITALPSTDVSKAQAAIYASNAAASAAAAAISAGLIVTPQQYGAKGDAKFVVGTVSITSGTKNLTVTGASFAAGDVGKSIYIPGAGSAGGILFSTIASVTGTTTLTIATNALTTLSAVANTQITYGTDDTIAIKAAVAAVLPTGGTINLHGRYLITDTITVDYTNATLPRRLNYNTVNFSGEGSGNTQIIHTGFSGPALNYIALNTLPDHVGLHYFRGFGLFAMQLGVGEGMTNNGFVYSSFIDVAFIGFDQAFYASDMLSSSFHACTFLYGNKGLEFEHILYSRPNAISFYSCEIGLFNLFGLKSTGGTCINFFGGSIEGNCIGDHAVTGNCPVMIIDPCVEGGNAFSAYGTHFEANEGLADVLFNISLAPYPIVINFDGCDMQRGGGLKTVYNILVQQNFADVGKVTLNCRSFFGHFLGYTPSSSEPAIRFLSHASCEYDVNVEGSYFGSDLYRWGEVSRKAAAAVRFNGTTGAVASHAGVDSVTRNGTGDYTINLRNFVHLGNPIVMISSGGTPGVGYLASSTTTSVRVLFVNLSSVATDPSTLSVVIYDQP